MIELPRTGGVWIRNPETGALQPAGAGHASAPADTPDPDLAAPADEPTPAPPSAARSKKGR